MIANPQTADKRFDVITRMGLGTLDQAAEIKRLAAQLEIERARANKAESQVHQLEVQLVSPAREVQTICTPIEYPNDWAHHDIKLTQLTSAGWTFLSDGFMYVTGEKPQRYTSLIRVAPIPAEPDQPSATVAAAATKPAPAATPGPAVDPNPESLPVTRKTVTATAILEAGEVPESPADEPSPVESSQRGEEIKATAEKAFNEALARNPLPAHRPLSSFKSVQGSAP